MTYSLTSLMTYTILCCPSGMTMTRRNAVFHPLLLLESPCGMVLLAAQLTLLAPRVGPSVVPLVSCVRDLLLDCFFSPVLSGSPFGRSGASSSQPSTSIQVNPVILQEWDRRLKNITGEI